MGSRRRTLQKEKARAKRASSTNAKRRQRYATMAANRELGGKEKAKKTGGYIPKGDGGVDGTRNGYANEHPSIDVPGSYAHQMSGGFSAYAVDRAVPYGGSAPVICIEPLGHDTIVRSLRFDASGDGFYDISRVMDVSYSNGGTDRSLGSLDAIPRSLNGPGGRDLAREVDEIRSLIRDVQESMPTR